jgi:hypothetical protein
MLLGVRESGLDGIFTGGAEMMLVLLDGDSVSSLHLFEDGMIEVIDLFLLLAAGPNG